MKLHFLGGADEVGASCTLIEIENHRILVDAGIRMGAPQGQNLPNFAVLDDTGPPDEVLITHAHTDHTGALPVLAATVPKGVPFRCTAPTLAIARVLLSDAVKIMGMRQESEGELPLYPPEAADACVARLETVPWLTTVPLCGGRLKATWIPSGHILGAAQIYIEGERESVLMSGDVSVANQRTIPGMTVPRCRPDAIVLESTYGNRHHADRDQQERALVERVAGAVENGGKVLIPAFAVGRAQEVQIILAAAMRKKVIPEFPVFVDGMVRSVNTVYGDFPDDLAAPVRRRVEKGEDLFYGGMVGAVGGPADRDRILNGPPCCIVASSGMLIGGASSYYAERMASEPRNLIAITGYQDEESPGRALLNLVKTEDEGNRVLTINGKHIAVACNVETYSLSAHADAGELAAYSQRLAPRRVWLVHGDAGARLALAERLETFLSEGVELPVNGSAYTFEGGERRPRGYGRHVTRLGIAGGRALDTDALQEIRTYLVETGVRGPFRVQELSEVWFGFEGETVERVVALQALLKSEQRAFESDWRRPYLYRVADKADSAISGPMEMNAARERIQNAFPPEAGLMKCSAHVEAGTYELAFHFPDIARSVHAALIADLEKETGWRLVIRDTPHQARLFEEALAALPEEVMVRKGPALQLDKKLVVVQVDVPPDLRERWPGVADELASDYRELTGFGLDLVGPGPPKGPVTTSAPEGAMEINKAYEAIREAFAGMPHAPSKVGQKSDPDGLYIETAFISPAVGLRYRSELDALESRIGWRIRVRESANQEQIALEARRLMPRAWAVKGAPRLFAGQQRVIVQVLEQPDGREGKEIAEAFFEATGFKLELHKVSEAP